MAKKFTYVPNARVAINGVEAPPTMQQVIDTMLMLEIPLKHIQKLANAFGGYVELKLTKK